MISDQQPHSEIRSLESIFKAHFENSVSCSQVLHDLFSNLEDPIPYITKIKQHEEAGDDASDGDERIGGSSGHGDSLLNDGPLPGRIVIAPGVHRVHGLTREQRPCQARFGFEKS